MCLKYLNLVIFSVLASVVLINPSTEASAQTCRRYLALDSSKLEALGPVVAWDQLLPGQTHFGKHIVENYDFKRPIKVIDTAHARILDKRIPVLEVKNHQESYYIMVDNHHTLLRFVSASEKVKNKELLVPINIVESLTIKNFDHTTMQRLVREGYAWAPEKITSSWRLKTHWPQNILQLQDMPLRSVVQLLFFELDLSGKSFRPYMQFYLAEVLKEKGFVFKAKDFESTKKELKLKKRLHKFLDQNPEVLDLLKQNILPNDIKGAQEKLEAYQASRSKK